MELRALRYFVTVAEELHFGRAAERLGIVQPAVSQQIARLERELGVRLLDRSPRTVRLTEAGRRVLGSAREALAAAERVRTAANKPGHRVRIGTTPGLGHRLERGIDALREHNPSFEVVLVELPVGARIEALRNGELDLALARGQVSAAGLRIVPAWSEPLRVLLSAHHPAATRDVIGLAELEACPLRIPSRDCDAPLHDAVITALHEAGLRPRFGRPTGTIENTLIELGTDPRSWSILPADLIPRALSARVHAIPVAPEVTVTGNLLIAESRPAQRCVETALDVFLGAAGAAVTC
ncbi:LysR family transcriptional regulator [Amycolatopsis cynarae]|uniref:LysR family transcriptional regulator n=1 Tax=Amycolatopsis cynarae TaxID=2995223 RepID=A0ABY7BCY6_9PSEU|nr:LysR family transcriptional regulator [Amycolatopsis sp. HUAS 11-8]WAL68761.1 LysR family transcriptional regulator [Amycolatopsis sp. HUAS 11-8]